MTERAENRPQKTLLTFLPSHNNRGNKISLSLCLKQVCKNAIRSSHYKKGEAGAMSNSEILDKTTQTLQFRLHFWHVEFNGQGFFSKVSKISNNRTWIFNKVFPFICWAFKLILKVLNWIPNWIFIISSTFNCPLLQVIWNGTFLFVHL